MLACRNCAAPFDGGQKWPIVCRFCSASNDAPPKEVPVPVQVVHNVVQVVAGSAAEVAHELRCPHCGKRLVTVQARDVDLHGCSGCGGIWIDNGSARRVLGSPDAVFGELARRAGDNARSRAQRSATPRCAACPAVLDRVTTHGIELEVCAEHGTWFDAFELRHLVAVLRGEARAGNPATQRRIRCSQCRDTLSAERANLTDDGIQCDACWRKRQAMVFAAAEQQHERGSAVAIGGALLGVAAVMLGAASAGSRS